MPVKLNILQHVMVASVLQCEGSEGRVLWKCCAQEQISMANSNKPKFSKMQIYCTKKAETKVNQLP